MPELTMGQKIKYLREKHNLTLEQVGDAVGVGKSTVRKWENGIIANMRRDKIAGLAKALHTTPAYLMGWEEPTPDLPTDAVPIDFSHLKRIPILGRIAAGSPIYAEQNIEGYTYTDLNGGAEYFGLRVRGDSMDAARIYDGDVVIIRRQDTVDDGAIAAVLIDGQDATLKRFSHKGYIVTLMPQSTNPANQPFIYDLRETSVRILGLVVKVEFSPK